MRSIQVSILSCFSSHTNNVHMGLNYSLLPLNDHDQIISDIEKFG